MGMHTCTLYAILEFVGTKRVLHRALLREKLCPLTTFFPAFLLSPDVILLATGPTRAREPRQAAR